METTVRRVAKNTVWLLGQAVLGRAFSFVLIIYLARKLGELNFGKFAFANAFVQTFIIIADLGISSLVIREVAKNRRDVNRYLAGGFFLKSILSLLTFGLIFTLANVLKCPRDTKVVIYLIGLCNILESLGGLCSSIFNAFEKMGYLFLTEIVEKIFLVLLCIFLLSRGFGLITTALVYLFSGLLYLALNVALLYRYLGRMSLRVDFRFASDLFHKSLPFALGGLLLMFYYYIDAVMLGTMKGEQAVGWYSAGYQLCLALGIISSTLLTAVFPSMSRLFKTSTDQLRNVYERSFKYLVALGVPISVGGVILAKRIIFLFYGTAYFHTVLPFQLLVSVVAFSYLNSLFGYFLTAVDRLNEKNIMFATSTLINVGLNLLLIPGYGGVGAAIATIASEVLFFTFGLSYIFHRLFPYFPRAPILKSLGAAGVMGIFMSLLIKINLALLVLFGILVYSAFLWLSGYFDKEDRDLFRKVMKSA